SEDQTDLADFSSPGDENQDTVCEKDQTDLADLFSLEDENKDADPHHFTSDKSKVQSDEVEGPLIGDHETQESEGGEADLHQHLVDCEKNPGQFIPVETFTLKPLSEYFQDNDLYEYIKVNLTSQLGNVWWEFYVSTATNVVFDDNEANHTTLRLFYDRYDSPVVSVDKVSVRYVSIEYDMCELNCVTCDKTLGNKLMKMSELFDNVCDRVWYKYRDSRSPHKFLFIVSHPHGCSKQVSVGQWKDRLEVDGRSQFTYTTCTCSGSSGAQVHCLGYDNHWSWHDLVHSGSLKSGLNYSGAGMVL
ncbi:hypothetical protein BgiBS90_019563, partial [Biomphalaria glabrata]